MTTSAVSIQRRGSEGGGVAVGFGGCRRGVQAGVGAKTTSIRPIFRGFGATAFTKPVVLL